MKNYETKREYNIIYAEQMYWKRQIINNNNKLNWKTTIYKEIWMKIKWQQSVKAFYFHWNWKHTKF